MSRTRNRVYINGGVAWVLATLLHPEDRKFNVKLSPGDFDEFANLLRRDPSSFPAAPSLAGLDQKDRQAVEAEIKKMQDIYPKPQRLMAGAEILKALSAELQFQERELFFTRDGEIAWLAAYIAEKHTPRK
jgi:hypothetical protein